MGDTRQISYFEKIKILHSNSIPVYLNNQTDIKIFSR